MREYIITAYENVNDFTHIERHEHRYFNEKEARDVYKKMKLSKDYILRKELAIITAESGREELEHKTI